MASIDPSKHPLLQQPLSVFDLPKEIVVSLSIRQSSIAQLPSRPTSPASTAATEPPSSTSFACNICLGVIFSNVQKQREHFKSDWHRYNVKTRMSGKGAISEDGFMNLVDGLSDSISGSESSDGSPESSDTALSTLLRRQHTSRPTSPSSDMRPAAKSPIVWFQSDAVPVTQFGMYTTIFAPSLTPPDYVSALQDMQHGGEDGRTWTLFMTAGGHFAGMIVRVKDPDPEDEEEEFKANGKTKGRGKGKSKPKQNEMEVLRHKTFHRYTTRRKQGGSQGLNDQAKGNAKSAGAQLRRYGEQALRDDIRALLVEWAEDIDASERIFVRASSSNKRIFWGYDDNVIEKGDKRIRTFPFPTRRPTLSELQRCLTELTRVKISHLTEDALRAMDEAYLASLPKPKVAPTPASLPPPKPSAPKLTKEEEAERDRWRRLLDMIRKGRMEPLKAFWEREGDGMGGIDATVPEWTEDGRDFASLLQVASAAGQEEVVVWLLETKHADPTVSVPALASSAALPREDDSDEEGRPTAPVGNRRTAYDVASARAVRNVFRRCAYSHPEWWDWIGEARVPSVLTPEMEEEQEKRKGARRKGLREKLKEREKMREEERLREEEEQKARREKERLLEEQKKREQPLQTMTGPQRLGGIQGRGAGAGDGLAGITPEMRARIERERRARAAEARMRGTT